MYHNDKLLEAKYFLTRLEACGSDYEATIFNLSAFVSAAKKALEFGHRDMTDKRQQEWFEDYMDSKPIFLFFKTMGDVCIHSNPLTSSRKIEVETPSFEVEFDEELDGEAVDDYMLIQAFEKLKGGAELTDYEVEIIERCTFKMKDSNLHAINSYYRFSEWQGPEDMIELCWQYMKHMEHFFGKAERKGYVA